MGQWPHGESTRYKGGGTLTTILLDPTAARAGPARQRVAGHQSLEGLTVGLLDIRKRQGDVVLDHLERLLGERGIRVGRYAKPTFTKPAPSSVIDQVTAECDAVVEGLAD